MQPLFAGESFSTVMTARFQQMKTEIEKLKCADVEIGDSELSAKAEKIAEKFAGTDIPKVDRAALEKTKREDGSSFWEVPFIGGPKFFSYSLAEHATGYAVEKIDQNRLFIQLEEKADAATAEAQERAENTLSVIEKFLSKMQEEADANFSAEKFKESALSVLKRKRDSCARLRAGGYAVR